jgi:hypothetical protein
VALIQLLLQVLHADWQCVARGSISQIDDIVLEESRSAALVEIETAETVQDDDDSGN